MSLNIIMESLYEFQWNCGDPKLDIDPALIRMVQADGEELSDIRDYMSCTPLTNKKKVTWFGDMAKFIAVNIGAVDLDD
jgi:hypothetical protein